MTTPNQTPSTEQVSSTAQQEQTSTNPQAQVTGTQENNNPAQDKGQQVNGMITITQSELDKLISKGIETATGKFTKQISDYESRIKGLEAQNMTAEELAAQQQKEAQEASAARIAELTESNQRFQIKAKIAETGLPLDENLFVNTSLEIEDIFKAIDKAAQKWNDDFEKHVASKQAKAGASLASKAGTGAQTQATPEYAKKAIWV